MDIADNAQAASEQYLQAALDKQMKASKSDIDSEYCLECGDYIPMERRQAVSCNLCVHCQEDTEKRNKHYRR